MPHVFKVKMASQKRVEEVEKLLREYSNRERTLHDKLRAKFGPETNMPYMDHKSGPQRALRDLAFSKMETKLQKTLHRDGFRFSHTDEEGFDVYLQEVTA